MLVCVDEGSTTSYDWYPYAVPERFVSAHDVQRNSNLFGVIESSYRRNWITRRVEFSFLRLCPSLVGIQIRILSWTEILNQLSSGICIRMCYQANHNDQMTCPYDLNIWRLLAFSLIGSNRMFFTTSHFCIRLTAFALSRLPLNTTSSQAWNWCMYGLSATTSSKWFRQLMHC